MVLRAFEMLFVEGNQEIFALIPSVDECGGFKTDYDPLNIPWEDYLTAEGIVNPEGLETFLSIFDAEKFCMVDCNFGVMRQTELRIAFGFLTTFKDPVIQIVIHFSLYFGRGRDREVPSFLSDLRVSR